MVQEARQRHSQALRVVAEQIRVLAWSRTAIRIARILEHDDSPAVERRAVLAIALTEMSARPRDARFVEWLCVIPLRHGILGSAGREWAVLRTVGPFQLRDAPLKLDDAVVAVRTALSTCGIDYSDPGQLAHFWHGPATSNNRGVQYSSVLGTAMLAACSEPLVS